MFKLNQFDFVPEINKKTEFGAMHTCEIPFVLGTTEAVSFLIGTPNERILPLLYQMKNAWVSFIKTGDPNNSKTETLEKYEESSAYIMVFDDACRMEHDDNKEKLLDVWKYVILYKDEF